MLLADLQPRMLSRRFWAEYFFLDDDSAVAGDWELEFDLGTTVSLTLSAGYSATLGLRSSSGEAFEIGWDDMAHWHPHVLRWCELDAICRRIAERDSEYAHPGVPLLLLHRFAPMATPTDLDMGAPLLRSACSLLGVFSDEDTGELLRRSDFSSAGVSWQERAGIGWVVSQDDTVNPGAQGLYSLRIVENTSFPFGVLNTLLAEIQ